jgi:hypothetical protein
MRIAIVLLAALVASPPAVVEQPVKVQVRPAFAFAPAGFIVRVTVEPHEDNRALTIVVESKTYRESTTVPLDGEYAPRAHVKTFEGLPVGDYVFDARVERRDGSTEHDARDVRVFAESPLP